VDIYTSQKTNIFLRSLSALAKLDLANQSVRQPVQLHTVTFNAQLPVFDETSAQPDFVVVNYSDVVMNRFGAFAPPPKFSKHCIAILTFLQKLSKNEDEFLYSNHFKEKS